MYQTTASLDDIRVALGIVAGSVDGDSYKVALSHKPSLLILTGRTVQTVNDEFVIESAGIQTPIRANVSTEIGYDVYRKPQKRENLTAKIKQ